ncbi:MAG: helix-turn-helix domain-containing protein [Candidatus Binatia bacterium]
MPLVFVGGARGTGKTTLIKALKATYPHVEHVGLAVEVNRITAARAFHDEYVGMRRLTPEQQHEAVSKVVGSLAQRVQNDPSKIIFVDGHFVSSSFIDNHESFIPCLGETARLFEKMIWVKIEPRQILYRRFRRERIARPLDLTIREYFAEGIEATFLESEYGTPLLKCTDEDFFDAAYVQFDRYLRRQSEPESSTSSFKVQAVMRLIRGDTRDSLSQELGITVETLSKWLHRFIAAGCEELDGQERKRAQDIAHLKHLVEEMVRGDSQKVTAEPMVAA